LLRFDATQVLLKHLTDEPVVPNLGPTADELWHAGDRDRNFYTYGSMGLCSSIALGMALSIPDKIISLDGDGSLLMNLGAVASIGRERPKNLIVVVWDNEMWGQTGGQATHTAFGTELDQVAKSCGIVNTALVHDLEGLDGIFKRALVEDGPWFIVAKVEDPPEPFPLCPNEPEMTLYRFRRSFVGQEIPRH
jgi:sulfopyruvate decarboxylase subunit beta|tara:strand:+ start:857 stop:1432 length:576 start_codon:yes stop_codon:yes gene_type:complete